MDAIMIDGKKLYGVCRLRKCLLAELAAQVGTDVDTLESHMRSDGAPMPIQMLQNICDVLKIDVCMLYPTTEQRDIRAMMRDALNEYELRMQLGEGDLETFGKVWTRAAPYLIPKLRNEPDEPFLWTSEALALSKKRERLQNNILSLESQLAEVPTVYRQQLEAEGWSAAQIEKEVASELARMSTELAEAREAWAQEFPNEDYRA